MVGEPNRRGGTGRCLPARFFREYRRAVTVVRKHNTARKTRHTCADNCDSLCHITMV
jgi:hypothetical protein